MDHGQTDIIPRVKYSGRNRTGGGFSYKVPEIIHQPKCKQLEVDKKFRRKAAFVER